MDIRMLVCLPDGEDMNEWLAYHSKLYHAEEPQRSLSHNFGNQIEKKNSACLFLDQISQLYGLITEFCDERTCPVMNAGPATEYLWMACK